MLRKELNMRIVTMLGLMTLLLGALPAVAAVHGREVDYRAADGTELKGYLVTDDSLSGRRPGVLVVHEWWGHNAYARKRAEMLGGLGYTALAVDMYGGGQQAAHPEDAGKFAGAVRKNLPVMKERFLAALELLRVQPGVDPAKIAAIGYCFGGSVVLEMARAGVDLKGVASFHGSLGGGSMAQPHAVKARVLVLNGADDGFITAEQVTSFKKEMDTAGVNYTFINYPGARHSFTNPDADEYAKKFNMPIAYNAEADKASWQELQRFLAEIF
jgi:dienelactone hydrolase